MLSVILFLFNSIYSIYWNNTFGEIYFQEHSSSQTQLSTGNIIM